MKEMPKVETKFEVVNQNDKIKLYLYGVIRRPYSWEDESDVVCAQRVINALDGYAGDDIEVHINSPGGDVFESITIYNVLKQHTGEVVIYVDGLAASGASIITMAGDKVIMGAPSMMMVHKAMTYAYGNADELQKVVDDLNKIDTSIVATYKTRFVGTEDELKDLIKNETWLTADECKTFGFCDEILDEISEEEPGQEEPQASVKENLLAKYQKDTEGTEKGSFFDAFNKN